MQNAFLLCILAVTLWAPGAYAISQSDIVWPTHGPGGEALSAGTVEGKEAYLNACRQIVASLKVAGQRRAYLETLRPSCKS